MTKFDHKINDIRLQYKIWIEDSSGTGIMGDGKWKILKLIEQKGSLKAACDDLGWTYRRTWGNLKKIEDYFGFPLLARYRGGSEGGTTQLTAEGKKLVSAFDHFHSQVDRLIQDGFMMFLRELQA